MKKQVLNQIEKFVKECNKFNASYGRKYTMHSEKYGCNRYAVIIEYDLFHSFDMKALLKIVLDNNLLMMLGTCDIEGLAYLHLM